jgi:CBS domain containing-hemolysin-like protein
MTIFLVPLEVAAVLLLVFLNGFFVAAEFAIVKVRSTQIESLVKAGSSRARIAQNVVTHLDAYLSATQLGITMTSLGLGWVGEPFVAQLLQPVFGFAGVLDPAIVRTVSFAVGFTIITFLHIVLGEQAPKWLAIQNARSTALAVSRPLHLFFLVFRPFITLLNASANYFLRLAGVRPASEMEVSHSEEELRLLLSRGKSLTSTVKNISLRAIELRDRSVREVMVPRTSIVYLSMERTLNENIAVAVENQFTRYPLCEKNLDNIVGMIHMKDLYRLSLSPTRSDGGATQNAEAQGQGSRLLEIKREMFFVPETTSLEKILNTFLARRVLMAIAVDEYGGTAGLITLENVLEELVGEIRDEFDVEPLMVQKVNEGEYLVNGRMPLHDFARMFEVIPDSHDVVTVSGYAIQLLGRVPEKGATIELGQWSGCIEAIEGKTVKTLRIKNRAGQAA